LRAGLGIMMVLHGWPKLAGGAERWEQVGGAMAHLGIHFWPVLWGFAAAMSEVIGGALLAIGFLTRFAAILLTFTMIVAAIMVYRTTGGNFVEWSHPAELAIVFFSLILIGAGRYRVDRA